MVRWIAALLVAGPVCLAQNTPQTPPPQQPQHNGKYDEAYDQHGQQQYYHDDQGYYDQNGHGQEYAHHDGADAYYDDQ